MIHYAFGEKMLEIDCIAMLFVTLLQRPVSIINTESKNQFIVHGSLNKSDNSVGYRIAH